MEIIGSSIIAIVQSILFYGREIGISMLLFSCIANGIIIYLLHRKNKIQNKKVFLLILPIILLSSTYFIFANKTFYMANIFAILILNILMYAIVINKENYFMKQVYNSWDLLKSTVTEFNNGIEFTKEKSKEYIKISDKVKKRKYKENSYFFINSICYCWSGNSFTCVSRYHICEYIFKYRSYICEYTTK